MDLRLYLGQMQPLVPIITPIEWEVLVAELKTKRRAVRLGLARGVVIFVMVTLIIFQIAVAGPFFNHLPSVEFYGPLVVSLNFFYLVRFCLLIDIGDVEVGQLFFLAELFCPYF